MTRALATITCLLAVLTTQGSDLARITTTVTQEVVAGGVDIETPKTLVLARQGIILVDGVPTLPEIVSQQAISIWDKRGTLSPITVSVEVTPMRNGEHVRDMSVTPVAFEGESAGVAGKRAGTDGAATFEPEFITAPAEINRVFAATVEVKVAELQSKSVVSGAWTGQVTYTVN